MKTKQPKVRLYRNIYGNILGYCGRSVAREFGISVWLTNEWLYNQQHNGAIVSHGNVEVIREADYYND